MLVVRFVTPPKNFNLFSGGATGGTKVSGKAGAGAAPQKKRLEPETDSKKLVHFLCGGNILKEGADPELQPRSEYPEWLWTLRTERGSVPLEELEPNSWPYWKRLHKDTRKQEMLVLKNKYKYHKF